MGSQIKVRNTGWEMGKEIFLCNATLASCPMKFYVLLDQWRVLYHLLGGNNLILLLLALDWKLKHQLFFFVDCIISVPFYQKKIASSASSFVTHVSLRELWQKDVTLWKSELGFEVIIISVVTLISAAFLFFN